MLTPNSLCELYIYLSKTGLQFTCVNCLFSTFEYLINEVVCVRYVCTCKYMHVCVWLHVHVSGSQRSTLALIPIALHLIF